MALFRCHECNHESRDLASFCPNCGAPYVKSPLLKFNLFYFVGGIVLILLYWNFIDADVAWFIAINWLAVGIALVLISYGLPRKSSSDFAGLLYWLGIAWLVLLFAAGTVLIWNDGIGIQELQLLLE